MPQVQLPLVPAGTTPLNESLAVQCRAGQVTYFNGHLPVFTHAQGDLATFRLFTSQLIVNGSASQGDIRRAFGVPKIAVQRAVERYRTGGAAAFFVPPKARVGAKLTPAMRAQVQALLDAGQSVPQISRATGVPTTTLRKALGFGRLRPGAHPPAPLASPVGSTQSERRAAAQSAPLGCATTRSAERLLAAGGVLREGPVQFAPATDVPLGGVLWALPALLAEGLLKHSRARFKLPDGFYPLETFFLVLAFMALSRVRSLEVLRYEPPGEWGQLLGLDRIPEVRTLRQKVGQLCAPPGVATAWSADLARDWLADQPEHDGVYYADGHTRVYHGKLAALPRRYVARQKLCLRGTTDYWVNALDGRPFFLVSRPVDPGLLAVLRTEIIPRLLADAPDRTTTVELAADPLRQRFTVVCGRAGFSPEFFAEQKTRRVAVLTYHKFPGADWAVEEFAPQELVLASQED
jgi:hypothetical protein